MKIPKQIENVKGTRHALTFLMPSLLSWLDFLINVMDRIAILCLHFFSTF